jgi:hypothetical protein
MGLRCMSHGHARACARPYISSNCARILLRTISHNDNCAEQLAAIRRGPGAQPEEEEFIEYLLSRKKRSQERPPCEHYAFEHVLSYQRRVNATKNIFMRRGSTTPLGCIRDWRDRTACRRKASAPPCVYTILLRPR